MNIHVHVDVHASALFGVQGCIVAFPSKIQGISGGGHGLGEDPQAVASLGGFFNWVQVIKGDCTGWMHKANVFQTINSVYM